MCAMSVSEGATAASSVVASTVDPDRDHRGWRQPGGRAALTAVVLVAAAVVPLWRQTGYHSWQTIFAEDGSIYSQQAIRSGGLHVLLRGYAGYVQLPPRLLALVTPYLPIRQLALYSAVASCVVNALLAWFVFRATAGWIRSTPARLALASLLVVMPMMGQENTAMITDSIWQFLAVLPWALVSRCEGRRATVARSAVVFLAAASTPLALIFVPLGLGWVYVRRTWSARMVLVAFTAGGLVQALGSLAARGSTTEQLPSTLHAIMYTLSVRVFGVYAFGPRLINDWWQAHWMAVVVAGPLLVLGVLALVWRGAERDAQVLSAVFLASAVVVFVVPTVGRGTYTLGLVAGQAPINGAYRFSVTPIVLVASCFALLLTRRRSAVSTRWGRVGVPVFVAQLALVTLLCFSWANFRSGGPDWTASVNRTWRRDCIGRPPDQLATVVTATQKWYPVTLPCRVLEP